MSALLTSERDNTDKIVEYVSEAQRMGITVLPPDINESQGYLKLLTKTIRFGLCGKNIGHGAVDSIVDARKEGSLNLKDLCHVLTCALPIGSVGKPDWRGLWIHS